MSGEEKDGGWLETLLGIVVLALVIWAGIFAWDKVHDYVYPHVPGVLSLSAYFDSQPAASAAANPALGGIKIRGDVSQNGEPVKSGIVRLTVSTNDNQFRQSISLPFQNGHFEADDPAFRTISPDRHIAITAEVEATGLNETATIYLNMKPPTDRTALGYTLAGATLILAGIFFFAFTGPKTPARNQIAIIFSYVIIAVFLAVPLLAPTLLIRVFPGAVCAMIGAPAGLVNTRTPNQEAGQSQWALNIGGYSHDPHQKVADKPNTEIPGSGIAEKQLTPKKPAPAEGASGENSGAIVPAAASGTSSASNPAPTAPQGLGQSAPAISGPNPPSSPPTLAESAAATCEFPDKGSESAAPLVEVEGGLVIPLYVIILSVIGGAINMTRKVPAFQGEGESDFNIGRRPIALLGAAARSLLPSGSSGGASEKQLKPNEANAPNNGGVPAPSIEDQARTIEDQLTPLVTDQVQSNSESDAKLAEIRTLVGKMREIFQNRNSDNPILRFSSFEDWIASHPRLVQLLRGSWRVELLNQYMYLISAPFLAIVTYYLLDLLGLSKPGVVVVLSFSVGLISERIVTWILGIATGYLRTDAGKTTP